MRRLELVLLIGELILEPAPAHVMGALRGVEVTQKDQAPSGFQLTFAAGPAPDGSLLVDDSALAPGTRLRIQVVVDGTVQSLIDGFVTHHQHMPGNGPDEPKLVVTGEDFSVMLDLTELSIEYPSLNDAAVVALALTPWLAMGLAPEVAPGLTSLIPSDRVLQQSETPRALLQRLAQQHGYVFYVTPLDLPIPPEIQVNKAYWGPPNRFGDPMAVIDVGVGAASTSDSFQAEYDALATQAYVGLAMETLIEPYVPLPVLTLVGERLPPLAARPTPPGRIKLWQAGGDPITANLQAQGMTDASSDSVVKVTCEASTARLGAVLVAPGVVGVRGAGESYDGLYYLQSATHTISLEQDWNYKQSLVLTREGVGSTVPVLIGA